MKTYFGIQRGPNLFDIFIDPKEVAFIVKDFIINSDQYKAEYIVVTIKKLDDTTVAWIKKDVKENMERGRQAFENAVDGS